MSDTDFKMRAAEKAHDRAFDGIQSTQHQVEVFASAAMRAPALVAAGGVAAALGFFSANYSRFSDSGLSAFNDILFWMFLSLMFTVVAPSFAYFSQLFYVEWFSRSDWAWEDPYVRETRGAKVCRWIGHGFRFATYGLVIASVVTLAIGGLAFLNLVRSAS